jgi:D-glycero-D-manno-heptose 1,7-bisphosphate phosphatase
MPEEKIIFLDRDGVINFDPIGDYIKTAEDFKFLPGVSESLKSLTDHDFKIVVISNQAGVGDGVFTKEALGQVNDRFLEMTEEAGSKISDTFYCLHGKQAGCDCRKPEIGLFHKASDALGDFDIPNTFYVGDKATDIVAGKTFGLKALFVLTGHGQNELHKVKSLDSHVQPEAICDDLKEAVDFIIQHSK